MRRRQDDDPDILMPPVELVDYGAWCSSRNVPAYGDPDDVASMRAAVSRYAAWAEQRQAWASAHGADEGDMDLVGAAPWDENAI